MSKEPQFETVDPHRARASEGDAGSHKPSDIDASSINNVVANIPWFRLPISQSKSPLSSSRINY